MTTVRSWEGTANETPIYYLSPTVQGSYSVELLPADTIQVDAFIPEEWVYDPLFSMDRLINSGNDRMINGMALFDKLSEEFKLRERVSVWSVMIADPDGSVEQGTLAKKVGPTRVYDYDQAIVDGHLTAEAKNATTPGTFGYVGTAQAGDEGLTVSVSHPSQGVVVAHLRGEASNPAVGMSEWAPIIYDVTVTIDRSDPQNPNYTVTGNHCEFPSYEVYINSQRIHHYDSLSAGKDPEDLVSGPDQVINNNGLIY